MLARRVTLIGCAVALGMASLAGQGQTPTFRTGIDAVTVDVVVTDRQGRPVTDLKAEDFEVLENRKPQTVQTFKFIKVDTVAPELQSSYVRDIQSMDDQRREASRDDTRVLIIFLDDYHTRLANSLTIKQELAKFLSQLTINDLVAVVYPLTPSNSITFTRNHEATAATVMGFLGRKYNYVPRNPYENQYADYPPEFHEQMRNDVVITALRGFVTFLGTIKEGKKNLLYVSEGLTGSMPAGVTTRGEQMDPRPAPMSQTQRFFAQAELSGKMSEIFRAATRSNTSIYTLDPRGLAIGEGQINDNITQEMDRASLNEAQDSLHALASNTDGRAIVNRNAPLAELQKMTSDLSAYYLLGYTSTEAPRDGKFHEITVRVKRPNLEIRARKGYWAYTAEDVARATSPAVAGPPAAVEDALSSLAVARDRPVRLWVGSQRGADGKTSVTLAWEPTAAPAEARPRQAAPEVVDRIVLTATSLQGETLFRGPVPRAGQGPAGAVAAGSVVFTAPPGTVQLNIQPEDARGTRLDRDDTTIEVPDFTKVSTAISTPAVYRGRTVRDIQTVRSAASPVPTVAREFSRTERLLIRFQAYGPGASTPAIKLRFLNSLGRPMSDLPAPTRLPDGTFETEIGLGSLGPGKYLIEINATHEGETAQSLLPFQVTQF
jgi:VWFA-related protein